MSRNRLKPNPVLREQICRCIRVGAYPHVAAELAGVPRELFQSWLQRATEPRAPKAYRDFEAAVREAQATARCSAEMTTFKEKPLVWLRSGPGRESQSSPGWSHPVRATLEDVQQQNDWWAQKEVQRLTLLVYRLLEPHPELRAQLSEQLAQESLQDDPGSLAPPQLSLFNPDESKP